MPQVNDLVSLYKEHAKIPIPSASVVTRGLLKDNSWQLKLSFTSRDCEQVEINTLTRFYNLESDDEKGLVVTAVSDSQEADPNAIVVKSASGKKVAAFKCNTKDGKEKSVIDILIDNAKEKSIDLDVIDAHGKVITKPPFASFAWSPNESHLLYLAEKKEPKPESYFKIQKAEKEEKKETDGSTDPGNEFLLREDWGETLTGVRHPVVCVLNIETQEVRVVDVPGFSLADAQWIDDGNVVFVGYEEGVRRLGIIYCMNRKSQIFSCNIASANLNPVSIVGRDANLTLRCPRVSPDGKQMVYLENTASGAHFKASRLNLYNLESKKIDLLVDYKIDGVDKVKALYIGSLPNRCWNSESNALLFDAESQQKHVLVKVDSKTKKIDLIQFPCPTASVMDYNGSLVVASGSSLDKRPAVFAAQVTPEPIGTRWIAVTKAATEKISYSAVDVNGVASLLVSPSGREGKADACFVVIHGGPHASFTDSYLSSFVMFAKLGFKSLIINYRGSTGFDEDYVNALPGRVGDVDVKDCIAAVDHFVAKGKIDASRLVLYGGSHGGFLVAHLSAQFPKHDWLSVVARNPVIDLTSLIEVSDIPDWTAVETMGPDYVFDEPHIIDVKKLVEKSPYHMIDNVKAPTLLLLGSEDRRVPMSQGLKWYHGLKGRGVECKCYVYPDRHALQKVDVNSDGFVNMMIWILKRLGPDGLRK